MYLKPLQFLFLSSTLLISCTGEKQAEELQASLEGMWTRTIDNQTEVLAFTESEAAWEDLRGKTPISQFFAGNYNNPDYPILASRGTWKIKDNTLSFSNTWNDSEAELLPADLIISDVADDSITLENEKWISDNVWTRIQGLRNAPADMPFLGRFEAESPEGYATAFDVQDGRVAAMVSERSGWVVVDRDGTEINSRTASGQYIQLLGEEVIVGSSSTAPLLSAYALSDAFGTWSWPSTQGYYDTLKALKRTSDGLLVVVEFKDEGLVPDANYGVLFQWLDASGNSTQQLVATLPNLMDSLHLLSVDVGADGNTVFSGSGYGQVEIDGTTYGEAEAPYIFWGSIDSSGNLLGLHTSPKPEAFIPSMNIVSFPNGDVGLFGAFQGEFTFGGVNWETETNPDDPYSDSWDLYAMRLRANGTPVWTQRFEDTGIVSWFKVSIDSNGRTMLIVSSENPVAFDGYTHQGGHPDVSFVLLNGCGQALWGEVPKERRDTLTYVAASTAGILSSDEAFWVAADRGIRRYTGPRTGSVEDSCAE